MSPTRISLAGSLVVGLLAVGCKDSAPGAVDAGTAADGAATTPPTDGSKGATGAELGLGVAPTLVDKNAVAGAKGIRSVAADAPVLRVDGKTFSRRDVERAILQAAGMSGIPDGVDGRIRDMLEAPAYDKLLERQLLADEAKKRGLWPTDAEVAGERDRLTASMPKDRSLADILRKLDLDEKTFLADLSTDLALAKLIPSLDKDTPKPSDADVQKAYEENKQHLNAPERVKAGHVLVAVAADAAENDVKAAEAKANKFKADLAGKNAAGFAAFAKEHSDDPSAKTNNGDLGTFAQGDLIESIEQLAFAAKPGAIVGPVRTERGFHVIRVESKIPGGVRPLAEVKENLENLIKAKALKGKLDNMIAERKKAAKVERIVEPMAPPPMPQMQGGPGGMPPGMMPPMPQ